MQKIYDAILIPWLLLAVIVFFILFRINAPYGKFFNLKKTYSINYKLGWIIQEIISPITFGYFFLTGTSEKTVVSWMFLFIWMAHYLYRSIFFPLRMKNNKSQIPLAIILSASFFNIINGFINGYYFGTIANYSNNYLYDINFIIGLSILIVGVTINIKADNVLIKIKSQNEGYKIPHNFLYKYISCPNYFGEIIEWGGFAIMAWSFPALVFFIWTIANLSPRALATHKWYLEKFEDYPKNRKAIIPFII